MKKIKALIQIITLIAMNQTITKIIEIRITKTVSMINDFIENFNSLCDYKIIVVLKFDIKDKENDYYRVEYRLFDNATSRTRYIQNYRIDLIYEEGYLKDNFRLFLLCDDFDINVIKTASFILGETLIDKDIDDVIKYIDVNKEANGHYYGKIGIDLLLDSKNNTYELMIKVE